MRQRYPGPDGFPPLAESSGCTLNRGSSMRVAGDGVVGAAVAGQLTGCSAELPGAAIRPWRNANRETDSFGRRILIGCGAFLALAVIAAADRRVPVPVEVFPDGGPANGELSKGSRVATRVMG